MKKIISAFAATAILAVALLNNANAQFSSANTSINDVKLTLAFAASINSGAEAMTSSAASTLNVKAVKDFQKSFKNAANVSWFKADNGAFLASFTEGNVKSSVAYDKKGKWLYSIKRYSEKELAKDLRSDVKSIYYDFSIVAIDEVSVNDKTIYLVHLEDASALKTIRICDGDMEEVQDFVRG